MAASRLLFLLTIFVALIFAAKISADELHAMRHSDVTAGQRASGRIVQSPQVCKTNFVLTNPFRHLVTTSSASSLTSITAHEHELKQEQEQEVVRSDGSDSSLKVELDPLKSTSADASITAHEHELEQEQEVVRSDGSDSSLRVELNQLKSHIRELESRVDENMRELQHKLKSKDDIVAEKEKIIHEMANSITMLKSEIASLQKKGMLDSDERVAKAYSQAGELEKQVEKFRKEIETKDREKEVTESQKIESEKKMVELNLKLENLQKIIEEQKTKIQKTERALQVAEEEMMKAKFEATSKTNELMEVHGAWLPPWLGVRLIRGQSFVETHWNMHRKPAVDKVIQKALEKAEKWAEPHVETIKIKWIPAVKETPHVIKVRELVDSYFQEVKKVSKSYIDQVATVTKPHVDKVRDAMKLYTKEIVRAYRKFLESDSTVYHQLGRQALVYDIRTTKETWELVDLKEVPMMIFHRHSIIEFQEVVGSQEMEDLL